MIGQVPMAHDGNVEGGYTISSWKRERKKCFNLLSLCLRDLNETARR